MKETINEKLSVWGKHLMEPNTIAQAEATASLPVVEAVALMPDAHVGIGATVGSVVVTRDAVLPGAVGVDIGCGMSLSHLVFDREPEPTDLRALLHALKHVVPSGFPCSWKHDEIPKRVRDAWEGELREDFEAMKRAHRELPGKNNVNQLGTLGGGNHFVEIAKAENGDDHVLILHSGSRGIGNRIGTYFLRRAKAEHKRRGTELPHPDLAWLEAGTPDYDDYLNAVAWAQCYAKINRMLMRQAVVACLSRMAGPQPDPEACVDIHHNYVERMSDGRLVTRKGAVDASLGKMVIIPGSMGARTYLASGLGSVDSFNSCSHGAGRRMGRKQATREIAIDDHKASLLGVVCDSSERTLDESPAAYKNIDDVMDAQRDLVQPVRTFKQIMTMKGEE